MSGKRSAPELGCDLCDLKFDYPSKMKRHLESASHKRLSSYFLDQRHVFTSDNHEADVEDVENGYSSPGVNRIYPGEENNQVWCLTHSQALQKRGGGLVPRIHFLMIINWAAATIGLYSHPSLAPNRLHAKSSHTIRRLLFTVPWEMVGGSC